MKKIIIAALAIAALYHFKPELFTFLHDKGAFDENGSPQTLIFTHNKCGKPCGDVLKLLSSRRINYTEYKLDNSPQNQELWKSYGGLNSFPNIVIGNERAYGSYKADIISKLALNYGPSVFNSDEMSLVMNHFDGEGEPKLILYGASWCQYCKKMRQELNNHNIPFVEIDVEKSPKKSFLIKTLDITGYPLMYYGFKRMSGPSPGKVLDLF